METFIHAIYDGLNFTPIDPIPVKGKYEVKIIFTKSLEDKELRRQQLLELSGSCSDEVVEILKEMETESVHLKGCELGVKIP